MKNWKGSFIICVVVILLCYLSFLFCNKIGDNLQRQIKISDSELEEYTSLAYDLSELTTGKISKILIQGQKKKISFVFPGSDNQQVTIDYSDGGEYKINSNAATFEYIESSIILFNKLINLQFDNIYRIEFDNIKKIISIQANSNSTAIFVLEYSNDKSINRSLKPSESASNKIYIWKKGLPHWLNFISIIVLVYVWVQYFKKRNKTKKQ